jgi:hypothetical protein
VCVSVGERVFLRETIPAGLSVFLAECRLLKWISHKYMAGDCLDRPGYSMGSLNSYVSTPWATHLYIHAASIANLSQLEDQTVLLCIIHAEQLLGPILGRSDTPPSSSGIRVDKHSRWSQTGCSISQPGERSVVSPR